MMASDETPVRPGQGSDELRVLHVDDNEQVLELSSSYLGQGHQRIGVATASAASSGLELLDERPIDCVVSDYQMPGMDGLEFLDAVREEHPDLPFLLFTGVPLEEVTERSLDLGVTGVIQKLSGIQAYKLLRQRIENSVEWYRAKQQNDLQAKLLGVQSEVLEAQLSATDQKALKSSVCNVIIGSDLYESAWLVEDVSESQTATKVSSHQGVRIQSTAPANVKSSRPIRPLVETAVKDGQLVVSWDTEGSTSTTLNNEQGREQLDRTIACAPAIHQGNVHGVLTIQLPSCRPIIENERDILEALGKTTGFALEMMERKDRDLHRQ